MTIRQNAADPGSILARLRFAIRHLSIHRREGSLRHLLLRGAATFSAILPSRDRRWLAQQRHDVALNHFGGVDRGVAAAHLALAVDQEFGEVPRDRLNAQESGLFRFQQREQRVGSRTVHVDFLENRETDPIVAGAKLLDGVRIVVLLPGKLVAREPKNHEPVVAVAR